MLSGNGNGISEMDAEKPIDPVQCRGARSMLGLSQEELAAAVGVSDRTIHGFEKAKGKIARPTQLAIRKVLEARGARFVEANGSVGVLVAA
jgi:DNA-binding XRE family transcriptional regulator